MSPVVFNTLIFFFVYTPLTLLLGLLVDAFRIDGADNAAGYELFLWFVVIMQMIVPTLMLFAVINLVIRMLGSGLNPISRRAASTVANGVLLPLFQGFLWAGASFSFTWVLVGVLPALVLGGFVRFPTRVGTA